MKQFKELEKYKKDLGICKAYLNEMQSEAEILNMYGILYEIADKVCNLSGFEYMTILTKLKRAKPYLLISKDYLISCYYLVEGYMNMVEDKLKMDVAYETLKIYMSEKKATPVVEDDYLDYNV